MKHFVPGTNINLAWHLQPCAKDPAASILMAPLLRLAKEWWLLTTPEVYVPDALPPPMLVQAFEQAHGKYLQLVPESVNYINLYNMSVASLSTDPITAAIHAARLLGWHFTNCQSLRTHDDQELCFTDGTPAMLAHMIHARYHDVL